MKHFTMNHPELKPYEPAIATDVDGCLYDRQSRRMVEQASPAQRPALEALGALRLAGRLMHLNMERWSDRHGLSEGRLQVLFRLRKADNRSLAMADLAASMSVSPRNITGLVDHLEKDGLVERVPDPGDRRSVLARLSDTGVEKIESLWRDGMNAQSLLAKEFTKEELVQLRHLCLRLVQCMTEGGNGL
jgi:DNA-binding MarR family transcriptional regulator